MLRLTRPLLALAGAVLNLSAPAQVQATMHVPARITGAAATAKEREVLVSTIFPNPGQRTMRWGERNAVFSRFDVVHTAGRRYLVGSANLYPAAHGDGGAIVIWTFQASGGGGGALLTRRPLVVEAGTFGAAPDWRRIKTVPSGQGIQVEGFGMWFGTVYQCSSLVDLGGETPSALPRVHISGLLTYYSAADDDGAGTRSIESRIGYDRANDRYHVRYTGMNAGTISYGRAKGRFHRIGGRVKIPSCGPVR